MKKGILIQSTLPVILFFLFCSSEPNVTFVQKEHKIDVMMNGKRITTYYYALDLTKPILYPVLSPSGVVMNRSFPFETVAGESQDHPHHTGLFFTYDDINGNGFWNNTTSPPQVQHVRFSQMAEGTSGTLSVVLHWVGKNGRTLLEENRSMVFYPGKDEYTVDFVMTLTAQDTTVIFRDTKEGMFAIRVADWLKEDGGSGRYLSSNGDETEKNIWGRRASWVRLEGEKEGKQYGIAILNHPKSTNFPTYWHARAYGLFSANPLGQYVFQTSHQVENPQEFKLTLKPAESAVFGFRMKIYEGSRTKQQLDDAFDTYVKQAIVKTNQSD
ncbi:MAG: PmoA family protein [bacterium]